jgi:GT2 family glycosyltransferase
VQNAPPVTAVIPVHNRLDLLARLLETMRAQTAPFRAILLVDNASEGGIPADLAGSDCRVIAMGENAGFARAVNRGWQAAEPGWIAVLNTDVELDRSWLERLLEQEAGAGFLTGTILSAPDPRLIDGTYDLVSRSGCAWRSGHGEPAVEGAAPPHAIGIAPATACLYRREVLAALGGFDESFESYLEDVELGLRCVRNGISGVYVPAALARHWGSATLGRWNPRVVRLTARNQLLLVARHYDPSLFRANLWRIVVGQCLWGLVAARHGAAGAWLAGKRDGLRDFHLSAAPSQPLADFLDACEREIQGRARGAFWSWYFRLTLSRRDEREAV